MRLHKLSTRLLLAFVAVVAVCIGLLAPSLHLLLRTNYVSRAAGRFQEEVTQVAPSLATAAEQRDRPALDHICSDLNKEFDGRVSVVAPDGRILGDSLSERCAALARPECVAQIRTAQEPLREQDIPLQDTVAVRVPVSLGQQGPATVRLALPLAPVRDQLARMYWLLFLSGLTAAVTAVAIGVLIARRIARPLESMTASAERISAGDFECSIPTVPPDDEIGRLAQSFGAMQQNLRTTLSQLRNERNQALAIVQDLGDGVVALSPEGHVILANAAAHRLLGLTEPALHEGTVFGSAAVPASLKQLAGQVNGSARAGQVELGNVTAGERVVQAHASPVAGIAGPGQTNGVVLVLRDMTEARRAETMGRELVANASHELRTPLAIIASTAETLRGINTVTDPRHGEFLEMIIRHTARLERLVTETLQLSQLEAGVPQGPWEDLHMGELIAECVDLYAASAAARGIRLTLCTPSEPAARVRGVESLLHQALGNLVDNAIRYTPEGGNVTIAATVADGAVALTVADTGPGIPADLQVRIFERFVRGPRTGAAAAEGTGLGLALVRRVAELHHGRVDLDSAPGKGSRFTLHLPTSGPDAA
ncbi:MAG: hypothetical protein A3K19_14165 [Lentisphaerae bacterium RIFOXYB12_FULL_65_16]|nr:MAG: hypothetical protein A3K18_16320 [Lentisphaerae bacterium RIFOXYA12_64_32]OGV89111.1 MAG: hypothetical protein A3K19_14165 [Lentisphaerae bacterium RIFOXYB12_FULL_65_16]